VLLDTGAVLRRRRPRGPVLAHVPRRRARAIPPDLARACRACEFR
jgi:hypothetical protein